MVLKWKWCAVLIPRKPRALAIHEGDTSMRQGWPPNHRDHSRAAGAARTGKSALPLGFGSEWRREQLGFHGDRNPGGLGHQAELPRRRARALLPGLVLPRIR